MSFPRYPKYKPSGVEWLGEVPEHWVHLKLKQMASKITDGAHVSPETDGGEFYFVSTKDVTDRGIDFSSALLTSPATYEAMVSSGCKPERGDVLFSKDGTVGKTIVIRESLDFVVASSLIIIRPDQHRVDPQFLHYLCQSSQITAQIESLVKGAGLPRLSIHNLLKVEALAPPLSEQLQVAAFLDRETAKIDALVEEQRRLIELLKEKRQAVISHAVTKVLNPHAKMKPSGIDWPGDVPAHWDIVPLRFLVQFISGGTPDKKDISYWDGTIPWVSSKDMKVAEIADAEDHVSEQAVIESGLKIIPADHIVVVVRGMILAHSFPVAITLGDITINQDLKALKCVSKLTPLFLRFVFEGITAYIVANADESAHGTKNSKPKCLGNSLFLYLRSQNKTGWSPNCVGK